MQSNFFKSSSILRKFLVFNLIVFLFLGIFTFLYLKAIKPNLVQNRSDQHIIIIDNTSDHINRLNIEFTKEGVTQFLLSTRFLFQNLDRVQLYDLNSNLLADTDTLDLAQDISTPSTSIQESSIDKTVEISDANEKLISNKAKTFNTENYVIEYSKQKNQDKKKLVIGDGDMRTSPEDVPFPKKYSDVPVMEFPAKILHLAKNNPILQEGSSELDRSKASLEL